MRYISCFTGIGGLEASHEPELMCEVDPEIAEVLRSEFPDQEIWPDVRTLEPPQVEVVAGGWPCQDLSIAGLQEGLRGLRSGLLLDMLKVARRACAHTVVAENVPNLLRLRRGEEFAASLAAFAESGYPHVAWRVLNAREFGLPQHRARVLMIASEHEEVALTLFRPLPALQDGCTNAAKKEQAAGFYWTAGTHSINYNHGYVPTIKVGSSLGIVSPPAVHFDDVVRKLLPGEALRLQGFDIQPNRFPSQSSAYKAAGNAVPRPVGRWVVDGLKLTSETRDGKWVAEQTDLWNHRPYLGTYPRAGFFTGGQVRERRMSRPQRATNLIDYLDQRSKDRLSPRASRGLLKRLDRSGQRCPTDLRHALVELVARNENGDSSDE